MGKKIVIVGGGVAGLSAGINALYNGFEPLIIEKNYIAGGECSYWKRGEFTIDNCIHWLVGTKPNNPQNKEWRKLGVLDDTSKILKRKYFYKSEYKGESIALWRDLERTEREMLELSPADEREIKRFINLVRIANGLMTPKENVFDWENAFKNLNLSVSAPEVMKLLFEYGSDNLEAIANRFKHPLLKRLFLDFSLKEYESIWLVLSYSFFAFDDADVPIGGSKYLVDRLINKYLDMGGKIIYNTAVTDININSEKKKFIVQIPDVKAIGKFKYKNMNMKKADYVTLSNGEVITADYFILACDINYIFKELLTKKKYIPKALKKNRNSIIYSAFQVAFSVDGLMEEVDDFIYFDCKPFGIGGHTYNRIGVRNYREYGDYIAPKGKTVIQCMFYQYQSDFKYWNELNEDKEEYRKEKSYIADKVLERLETRFPDYVGKIHLLDAWSPVTYKERNNCYGGAFMRFISGPSKAYLAPDIKGLSNVFLASHYLRYPGGLPTAAAMGELAIDRIIRMETIMTNKNRKKDKKKEEKADK